MQSDLKRISKCGICLFYIYVLWFKEVWGDKSILLYGTVFLATACVLLDMVSSDKPFSECVNPFIWVLLGYGLYSLLVGCLISKDFDWMLNSVITFFCYTVVCLDVSYISYAEKDIKWLMNLLLLVAALCAFQTTFFGQPYDNGIIVTTMSGHNNPNNLALVLMIGIYATLYCENRTKKHNVLNLLLSLWFMYVIAISGSRKCMLAGGALLIYRFITFVRTEKKLTGKKLFLIIAAVVFFFAAAYYVLHFFVNTDQFKRLTSLFEEGGDVKRVTLYKDAVVFWKSSPVFGIGYGQYQIYSRYQGYSHSTYAEILSCGGLIGCFIFFLPLLKRFFSYFRTCIRKQYRSAYNFKTLFIIFCIELFMGIGQIFIYNMLHLTVLLTIFMLPEIMPDAFGAKPDNEEEMNYECV